MTQQSATSASPRSDQKTNGKPAATQEREFDESSPIGSLKNLNSAMARWAPQLERIAPKKQKFDFQRFNAIVMSCASRTPKILLCTYYSLRQAAQAAAELGLELGGVSGEAFLIPYENRKCIEHPNGAKEWITVLEAQFIPGYKGFLRLAYESGLFRDLGCDVILPDDHWEPIRRGPDKLMWGHVQGEPQNHPPLEIDAERWEGRGQNAKCIAYKAKIAPLRGAYAFAKLKDPASDDIVKPIWIDRLEQIRLRSKAGKNGPWITDYHPMAQKTAVRNLWKYVPKTDVMKRAEELDQEFEFEDTLKDGRTGRTPEIVVQAEPAAEPSQPKPDPVAAKTSRVADRVRQRQQEQRERPSDPTPPPPPSSRPANEPPNHDGDAPDDVDQRQPGED